MRKLIPLLLLVLPALAHEFWLAPASYRVAVGAPVPLQLLVGENFIGDAWARPARKTRRLVRFGPVPDDSTDLLPALLADSVALPAVRCPAPGTHLVLLASRPSFIELSPAKFTAYLRAEGLDNALRQRELADETATKPGREAYQRCAKTLLFAAGPAGAAPPPAAADTAYRRVLGLALEIVPEQNPYRLRPGAALTVRVLRRGVPVAGALVQLWNGGAAATAPPKIAASSSPQKFTISPPHHLTTRTNRQGRALLRLPDAGPYLLATVRMEPAPAALAGRADWLSTWASLTFGGPGGPAARPASR